MSAVASSFHQRAAPSTLPEKMEGAGVDRETFHACLASLAMVNRLSLGYRPTLRFVDRLATRHAGPEPLRIIDVGSGYGDTLRAVARRLRGKGIAAELIGADLNPFAAPTAAAATPVSAGPVALSYVTEDARRLTTDRLGGPPHAIICALFTHHLEDDDLVAFLGFMEANARYGWFVNDLYRSRFAAIGFGALASLLRCHEFVRHDGPVSFARAFRKPDWRELLARAGIAEARLGIDAPFRLCVERLR